MNISKIFPKLSIFYFIITFSILFAIKTFFFIIDIENSKLQNAYLKNGKQLAENNQYWKNDKPIFNKSPGYSFFLSFFYKVFKDNEKKIKYCLLILQLIFSCILTIIIFYLTFLISKSFTISHIALLCTVFNPKFLIINQNTLQITFSSIFFMFFIFFFFKGIKNLLSEEFKFVLFIATGIFLSTYIWLDPFGKIYIPASILILLMFIKKNKNTKYALCLFFISSFLPILPWYIRNYNLTSYPFFVPCFTKEISNFHIPKIISQVNNISLKKCKRYFHRASICATISKENNLKQKNPPYFACKEIESLKVSLIWIYHYPYIFIKNCCINSLKKIFNFYSNQVCNKTSFHKFIFLFIIELFIIFLAIIGLISNILKFFYYLLVYYSLNENIFINLTIFFILIDILLLGFKDLNLFNLATNPITIIPGLIEVSRLINIKFKFRKNLKILEAIQ